MSAKRTGSRALIKPLRDFLVIPTENRNRIVDYITERMGCGEKSIALCFRGDYFTLYYRCCQLLKVKAKGGKIIGEFNFRYALPQTEPIAVKNELEQAGVNFGNNERAAAFVLQGEGCVTCGALNFILAKYISLIDDFIGCGSGKNGREKDRQQQLFIANFGKRAQTYFDIEYTEPRESLIAAGYYDYAQDKIAAHKKDKGGRFDLLGLRRTEEGFILQFVELKSNSRACTDEKSGVKKHIKDYKKYCGYETLLNARKADAVDTVNLLSEILGGNYQYGKLNEDGIVGQEIVFIFTDGAVAQAKLYKSVLKENGINTICYDENLNEILL